MTIAMRHCAHVSLIKSNRLSMHVHLGNCVLYYDTHAVTLCVTSLVRCSLLLFVMKGRGFGLVRRTNRVVQVVYAQL